MQYKSVRSSSKTWVKRSISAIAPIAFLLIAMSPASSWAITAAAISINDTPLTNNNGYTLFYPTGSTGLDSGDASVPVLVDGTKTYSNDSGGANALYFIVNSTTASFTPPNTSTTYGTYLMAFVTAPNGGSTQYPVPIAWYSTSPGNGVSSCEGNGGCAVSGTNIYNNVSYHFAVPYTPTQSMQIGIYPYDVCYLFGLVGWNSTTSFSTTSPCTANADGVTSSFATIPANSNSGFKVTFYVVLIPTSSASGSIDPRNTSSTQSSLSSNGWSFPENISQTLSFQPNGGTLNTAYCPSGTGLDSVYFPGDQKIFLDTTKFNNSSNTLFQVPSGGSGGSGSFATQSQLVIVSKSSTTAPAPTPDDSQAGFSSNIFARVPLGATDQEVDGFTNSTATNPTYYGLSVMVRDYAGFVASSQGCRIPNVQTAEVEGFLRNSKCFIATAAFRSMDAAPVAMLREFRDEILLNFSLGQAFVDWYYRWSPPAAEWLIQHPGFRYPVLLALVPVEIFAWLCLRPLIFLLFAGASLAVFFALKKRLAQSARGESA